MIEDDNEAPRPRTTLRSGAVALWGDLQVKITAIKAARNTGRRRRAEARAHVCVVEQHGVAPDTIGVRANVSLRELTRLQDG